MTSDRDPLDLCHRLLHNASKLVTLLIRRPVLRYDTTAKGKNMQQIHQTAKLESPGKTSTIDRFALVSCYLVYESYSYLLQKPLHSTACNSDNIASSLPVSYRMPVDSNTPTASSVSRLCLYDIFVKTLSMKRNNFKNIRKQRRKYSDDHSSYVN